MDPLLRDTPTRKKVPEAPIWMADGDVVTGQNVDHSLSAQEWMTYAPRYNRWLVDSLRGAWDGAQRVLDVGCSIGNVTHLVAGRLADTGSANALVVGLEIIPEAAARFSERFRDRLDMKVVCGDIMSPPSQLTSLAPFDSAVSFNVLEHIEDDVGALRAVAGLLKPGGRLGLLVPGGGNRLYGTLDSLDRHFRRYTLLKLRSCLEAARFDVVSIRHVNMIGAILWFLKGRVLRSKRASVAEVSAFDRMVPVLRRIDAATGPPFGQSLAAVARLRKGQD